MQSYRKVHQGIFSKEIQEAALVLFFPSFLLIRENDFIALAEKINQGCFRN